MWCLLGTKILLFGTCSYESLSFSVESYFLGVCRHMLLVGPSSEAVFGSLNLIYIIIIVAISSAWAHILIGQPHTRQLGASGVCFAFILLNSLVSAKRGKLPLSFILTAMWWLGDELFDLFFSGDGVSHHAVSCPFWRCTAPFWLSRVFIAASEMLNRKLFILILSHFHFSLGVSAFGRWHRWCGRRISFTPRYYDNRRRNTIISIIHCCQDSGRDNGEWIQAPFGIRWEGWWIDEAKQGKEELIIFQKNLEIVDTYLPRYPTCRNSPTSLLLYFYVIIYRREWFFGIDDNYPNNYLLNINLTFPSITSKSTRRVGLVPMTSTILILVMMVFLTIGGNDAGADHWSWSHPLAKLLGRLHQMYA